MVSRRAYAILSGAFAAASLLFGGVLSYQLWSPMSPLPSPAPAKAADAGAPASPPRLPVLGPVEDYDAIATRPLFSPTRRPTEAPPQAAAGPENPDGILLTGVVLAPSGKLALVRTPDEKAPRQVSQGQRVLDWTVEKIFTDRIVLRAGARTVEIKLMDAEAVAKRYPKPKRRGGAPKRSRPARPSRNETRKPERSK